MGIHTFIILLSLAIYPLAHALQTLDEFLTLSHAEKLKLDEFGKKVSPKLPQEFMRRDDFLIRFLREKDLDIQAAEKLLMEVVKWRKEEGIDTILKENWSYFEEEYPAQMEGCDNEGQPIISVKFGDWDVRREIISSGTERIVRYVDKIHEELFQIVLKMQKDGQNVTHVSLILDMGGFNLVSHGCPGCIAAYLSMMSSMQTHYAGYLRRMIMLNCPSYALPIMRTVQLTMSPKVREVLTIFGTNKNEWGKYLRREIPASQLTRKFSGTKEEGLSFQDLRKSGKTFRCDREFKEYFL